MYEADFSPLTQWVDRPRKGPEEAFDFAVTLEGFKYLAICKHKTEQELEIQVMLPDPLPVTGAAGTALLEDVGEQLSEDLTLCFDPNSNYAGLSLLLSRAQIPNDVLRLFEFCHLLRGLVAHVGKTGIWGEHLITLFLTVRTEETTIH